MTDKQPIYAVTDYDGRPYITAGKAYRVTKTSSEIGGSKDLFCIIRDGGREITCRASNCAHLDGLAGWHLIYSLQDEQPAQDSITLRPGDYVLTSELRDEAHYREVGEAFVRAGAEKGEFPNDRWAMNQSILPGFGWSPENGLYHGQGASNGDEWGSSERHLTPAQVIAAATSPSPERQLEVGDRVRVNGYRHEHQAEGQHCFGTVNKIERWEREGTALTVFGVIDGETGGGLPRIEAGELDGQDLSFHPSELDLVEDKSQTVPLYGSSTFDRHQQKQEALTDHMRALVADSAMTNLQAKDQGLDVVGLSPAGSNQVFQVGDKVRLSGHRAAGKAHRYGTSQAVILWERSGAILNVKRVEGYSLVEVESSSGLCHEVHPSELDLVESGSSQSGEAGFHVSKDDHDNHQSALDRYRTAQRQADERAAWDKYFMQAMKKNTNPISGAMRADRMLKERRERFPT